MDPKKKDFLKGAATGVAVGAVAGAIAGILLAPKSGKETRRDIAKYLHEMKNEIAERVSKLSDMSREKYQEVVESVVGAYEEAKKISASEAKEIKGKLTSGYERVKKAAKKAN